MLMAACRRLQTRPMLCAVFVVGAPCQPQNFARGYLFHKKRHARVARIPSDGAQLRTKIDSRKKSACHAQPPPQKASHFVFLLRHAESRKITCFHAKSREACIYRSFVPFFTQHHAKSREITRLWQDCPHNAM